MQLYLLMLGEDKHKSAIRQKENRHVLKTTCVNHNIWSDYIFLVQVGKRKASTVQRGHIHLNIALLIYVYVLPNQQ